MERILPILLFIFNYIKCNNNRKLDEWEGAHRELIFVYEHARHGARGPSSSYDSIFENGTDEYDVKWNYDGELSPIGKRQHYYLGVRNRIKYDGLIDFSKYDPREILIHATDYNRTHQSINSELIGMYGNTKEQQLSEEEMKYKLINFKYLKEPLKSQIDYEIDQIGNQVNKDSIPIFNIKPFPDKRIFLVDKCSKIDNYRDEKVGYLVENLYNEFQKDYAKKLLKFDKIKEEYYTIYNKMKSIADHYICDYDNQKDLSKIEEFGIDKDKFYNFTRRFYGTFIFHWFVDDYTSGLEETHLMQDLLGYMQRRIEHHKEKEPNYKAPKMVMDCGHDTTVGPIARFMNSAFGCGYHDFCDFACNVYFELFKETNNRGKERFTVDYYMDDDLLLEREDFESFKAKMESKFWNDSFADQFCGTEADNYIKKKNGIEEYSTVLLGATFVSTSLLLIFATSTIVFFKRYRQLKKKLNENPMLDKELEGSELPELT